MASNRYFVLGQKSHVHGPHPSFLTSAHGCTRFVPENLPHTSTRKTAKTGCNRVHTALRGHSFGIYESTP